MATKADICNLALSHIGIGKEITNLTTERGEEAQACRRFYERALRMTLQEFDWPFATRYVPLGLVTELDENDDHPTTEWTYSYRYPTNCLKIRKILSGIRNDTRQSKVSYKRANDDQGGLILTDQEEAVAEITTFLDSPTLYPEDFVMALSYRLAYMMAARLTKGDAFKLGDKAYQMYKIEISNAMANSANEEQADEQPDSEFIRIRGEA